MNENQEDYYFPTCFFGSGLRGSWSLSWQLRHKAGTSPGQDAHPSPQGTLTPALAWTGDI